MQAIRDTIYSFKARWFDPHAQLNRPYHVRLFLDSHHVEIFDAKNNKLFLKKSECPSSVKPNDFFVGAKVLLYGRHFELLEYLDPFTAETLGKQQQKAVLVLKGDVVTRALGTALDALMRQHFGLSALKMLQVTRANAEQFYEFHRSSGDFAALVEQLTAAPVVALELVAENCLDKLKQFVPTLATRCGVKVETMESAQTVLEAQRFRAFFFETPHVRTAHLHDCTCCVILPHILKDGLAGQVVEAIQQSDVRITAMELFTLDRTTAAEFLEVYEGVVPHFNETVDHLTTGPCLAMELIGTRPESVVAQFRERAGPWDVDMAKELQPQTIRARFGHDRVRNAVHCTDLADDGVLECEYFFDLLSKRQCIAR